MGEMGGAATSHRAFSSLWETRGRQGFQCGQLSQTAVDIDFRIPVEKEVNSSGTELLERSWASGTDVCGCRYAFSLPACLRV